jgi:NTE family protein
LNEDLNDGLGSGTVCRFAAMSGLEHVLASGALPPAFAPVEIDGEYYWDGGIVSNTPLWYAVDHSPAVNVLIVQVDLFSAEGELPQNLDQVMERHKDIMYSSKTRFDTTHVRENQRQRRALDACYRSSPSASRPISTSWCSKPRVGAGTSTSCI